MHRTIIIKVGNSLGMRIKRQIALEQNLQPGDEVEISIRRIDPEAERLSFLDAVKLANEIGGGIQSIPDPVAWQREIRKDRPLFGRDY